MTVEEKKLIGWVKEMKLLGISDNRISELLNVNQKTVNRWINKDSKPSDRNLDNFVENYENLFNYKEFLKDVYKKEKMRIKLKSKDYEGEYDTKDERNCFKFIKNKQFNDIENFKTELRNESEMVKIKILNKRRDNIYYSGFHGYYLSHGELKEFDIQTTFNTSLNNSVLLLTSKLDKLSNRDYVDFIQITEYWLHGSHYINGGG